MSKVAVNIHIEVLAWVLVFLGTIPRSEIAGLYEKYMFIRNSQTVF